MAEPRTAAGRALLERETLNSRSFALITADAIIAIEQEAAAIDAALLAEAIERADDGPLAGDREFADAIAAEYDRLRAAAAPFSATGGETDALRAALARLDHIARASELTPVGEAELRAALDQSYWLLHPDQRPSMLDVAIRADAERRALAPAAEHRMGPPRWEPGLAQDEWANRCLVDSELWPCAAISQPDTDRAAR